VALAVSPGAAFVVVAFCAVSWLLIARRLLGLIQSSAAAVNASLARFQGWIVETIRGRAVIDAFGLHAFARERYLARASDNFSALRRRERWRSLIEPVSSGLGFLVIAGALAAEAMTAADPAARVADLVIFTVCLIRLMGPISMMNAALSEMRTYGDSAVRITTFLQSVTAESAGGLPFDGLRNGIDFKEVTLRYGTAVAPALRGATLRIEKGELLAVVGPSGAGKSSLASILLRQREPSSGTVEVDGKPLASYDLASWRRSVCFVPQDAFLFNDTIVNNIRFGKLDADFPQVRSAAKSAHAHEFIARQAEGYETVIGDNGARLSGGERQRLAIARALIQQPDVLILDEATSQLDAESERAIAQTLEEIRGRCTLVVIAHRRSTIRAADRIAVLSSGKVVDVGTHEALLQRCDLYRRLMHGQAPQPEPLHEAQQ
jgi:ABC-type multidrug transport system fused ATPase/permease subunit